MNKGLLDDDTDNSSEENDIIYRNLDSIEKYTMMEDFEKKYDLDINNNNYKIHLCINSKNNKVYICSFHKNKFNNDYYLESSTDFKIPKNNKGIIYINIFRNNLNIYKTSLNYRSIDNNKSNNEIFGDENIFMYLKTKKNSDFITIYKVVYKSKSLINMLYNKYYKI